MIANNDGAGNPLYGASQPFGSYAPAADDVLVKYTYYGDANLDGVVSGLDYGRIDVGYASRGTSNPPTGWYNGDFNYDGKVDGSDYTLIDNAFNLQRSSLSSTIVAGTAAEVAGVPEPTSLGVLTAAAAGVLGRRRFRRR